MRVHNIIKKKVVFQLVKSPKRKLRNDYVSVETNVVFSGIEVAASAILPCRVWCIGCSAGAGSQRHATVINPRGSEAAATCIINSFE
jgi:uncharacterized spore protein YtfJ